MTTQDTHHEHNDADASMDAAVVEHSSAPENGATTDSTPSETSLPAVTAREEGETSPAPATDGEAKVEAQTSTPTSIEAEVSTAQAEALTQKHEADAVAPLVESTVEAPSALEAVDAEQSTQPELPIDRAVEAAATDASDAPVTEHGASLEAPEPEVAPQTASIEQSAQPIAEEQDVLAELSTVLGEVLSSMDPVVVFEESNALVENEKPQSAEGSSSPVASEGEGNSKAEEIRPFTDFIAEFRQAEAALRDSQVEALSILSSVASDLTFVEPQVEEALTLEGATPSDSSETTDKEDGVQVKLDETNVSSSSSERSIQAEAESAEQATEKSVSQPVQPPVRPVSPLLRPASRLRLPRHGVTRHQREEAAASESRAAAEAQANVESQPSQPASTEPGVEATPPRPARRYRFDRPATLANGANGSSPASSAPAAAESQPAPALNGTGAQARSEEVTGTKFEVAPAVSEQAVEPPTAKPAAQEAESPTVEHGRRRHNSHKEQPAAQPMIEPVVQEAEPASQPEEVAPEDLPPLEYSELQKASSRRRRRHRSGSSSVPAVTAASAPTPASSQPVQPPAPLTSQPAQPSTAPAPMTPAAHNTTSANDPALSPYTIVSGYTVNQMNQGNDLSGPFMGPDPSPARGSVMMRDGRTVRAETRTAQPSAPIYPPSRSVESGLSTAAMTQFANIVSQALQTQTDRMVSEFRRISQAPTNVSVSLPPFPSTERVGVFVDVANLLYSARTLRIGVDFGKLLDFLRGNRRLVRAHAYCPTSPQPGDEQMFLQAVKGLGYRITTKNYKTFSSGAKKADLDLDLCMDVVRLVDGNAVDCVVLVSGDSDFMPMLDYCSDHGVRVEVAAFDEAMSATLRQSCDLFINLSMLEEIRA